jgi:clan AA aspartic protease (TIGR02281 family)
MKIRKEELIIILRPVFSGPKGKCRIEMALDTGATFTMIPWNIAEKLGYDPALSKRRIHLVTASTTEVVPLITIKSIKLMGFEINDIEIACHDLPEKSRVEGLLGLNFLRNFNIDLYLKNGTLELKDP